MYDSIFIVGTGGFAREVLQLIDELGMYSKVRAFLEPDDIWEKSARGLNIMGIDVLPFSDYRPSNGVITLGIGDSKLREKSIGQLPTGTNYCSLIHPSARVSRWSKIGEGAIITAGCTVTTQIKIGLHCQLNLNTTIGHDCTIGDFFTTAPAVNISGACTFEEHVYFGTGAATRQGVSICKNVTIGMGAMVVKDVVESGVYIGIPAKKIN